MGALSFIWYRFLLTYLLLQTFKLTNEPNISSENAEVIFFACKRKYNFLDSI